MQFRLDGSGRGGRGGHEAAGTELLSLAVLATEAATAGLTAGVAPGAARAERLIGYAALLREIARRSGQVEMLARSAAAAGRARREAGADLALSGSAQLELAEGQALAFALVGDLEAGREARENAAAIVSLAAAPPLVLKARALEARLAGAEALQARDWSSAARALEALELAAKGLGALPGKADTIAIEADRLELLSGLGLLTRDRAVLFTASGELALLLTRIDPDRRPLSWVRVETLRGQALAALGDLIGDPAAIAEGVAALKEAVAAIPARHAPLDQARAGHALGLALQSLGEAIEEEALFDAAVKAFSPALEALDRTPTLPYRSVVAHDGAVCLARRAERRGDLDALEQAEAIFRDALKNRSAAADPLSWAVTQVALARIYEAQAALRPDRGERADAAFALASALEVFAERGLSALSAATLAALERVKEPA